MLKRELHGIFGDAEIEVVLNACYGADALEEVDPPELQLGMSKKSHDHMWHDANGSFGIPFGEHLANAFGGRVTVKTAHGIEGLLDLKIRRDAIGRVRLYTIFFQGHWGALLSSGSLFTPSKDPVPIRELELCSAGSNQSHPLCITTYTPTTEEE